jgi:YHS domain-containing protein
MKKLIAALLAGLLCATGVQAEDAVNKKCPLTDKDVDSAQTSTVSVTVGFCCPKCQGKFEADAKAKTEAVKKYAGTKESPANEKCPTTGKAVDKTATATASMTVAFCCEKCKAKFDADPKKYIAKVK